MTSDGEEGRSEQEEFYKLESDFHGMIETEVGRLNIAFTEWLLQHNASKNRPVFYLYLFYGTFYTEISHKLHSKYMYFIKGALWIFCVVVEAGCIC